MSKLYIVTYEATKEELGSMLTYDEAQALVNDYAEGMHPEQAADLVIREWVAHV